MDVTTATRATPTIGAKKEDTVFNPKGVLGKDDFLKLLVTELQYQDPTDPMDTEKILNQTSQLATLEAQTNTNKTMKKIADVFQSSSQFAAIGAIGKMADLGNDDVRLDEDGRVSFDIYFPDSVRNGTVEITDSSGRVVKTLPLSSLEKGVHTFTWDGGTAGGERAEAGVYHVSAHYLDGSGEQKKSRVGIYPVESVRFDGSEASLKLGSHYVPLAQIKEIYEG
ncbi:FlgD immunoglobulin-like domain containing protein [Hydrogenimonas sp. SS33]|uniref:flagellar hook capping FlgD N-terminal domain-containing protein n=1 Tax=Hydrogenimonas leucolamina TaxID=2954236 RepID=UPI00336BFD0D